MKNYGNDNYREVSYPIIRETDKAVYVEIQAGWAHNVDHFVWIPKSLCVIEKAYYIGDDEHGNPIYEDKLRAVARWFLERNKIY